MTKNRIKEEKLVKQLKHPKEQHSDYIGKLIDETIKSHNKVFLTTDWHLWKRIKKGSNECHERNDFKTVINNMKNKITNNDLLINLGDLCDGEFKDKEKIKEVIKTIPGKKILVIGNNDVFDKSFYKSCGFEYVINSFVWNNVIFSHMPIKNDNQINVHGHIHGYRKYWVPYSNQIDVAAFNGRTEPIELDKIIKSQKSYSKTIKECPEHFEEGYNVSLFISLFENSDPYND